MHNVSWEQTGLGVGKCRKTLGDLGRGTTPMRLVLKYEEHRNELFGEEEQWECERCVRHAAPRYLQLAIECA